MNCHTAMIWAELYEFSVEVYEQQPRPTFTGRGGKRSDTKAFRNAPLKRIEQ